MIKTQLSTNWRVKPIDRRDYPRPHTRTPGWMPAAVPGCVHTDLLAYGVIGDPFVAKHEAGLAWIDESDWVYETEFEWKADACCPRRILRFEGLDTVAEISLNGEVIGRSDNFFLPLELDVSQSLVEGTNRLTIALTSPVRAGEARRRRYFESEGLDWATNNFAEHAFVRKPGYMSGWDWGPRLVSAGIWGPVSLLQFESRILAFTAFQNRLPDGRFRVKTETQVEGDSPLTVRFGDVQSDRDLDIIIEHPMLWWPNGYGAPHLYSASASLASGHEIKKRIGLREIKLVQDPDSFGESFQFEVNASRVWAGGANWIPNDSFPSRITSNDYRDQIKTCRELNFNMLRVWGGGLYESEVFYDACDENGILVWQDFAYGCSYYAEGDEACDMARREAEYHVGRLRDRACLALWCGNNENLAMWRERWGGSESLPPRYYGERIYNEVLPEVIAALNPETPYIDSSPCAGKHDDGVTSPNRGGSGDEHYWDVWHGRGDWKFYADSTARFASEFGFASSCSRAQWDKALLPGTHRKADDPTVRFHDKTLKPFELYRGYVELHYPPSETLDDWVYRSQLNQRDALRFGIEHYRSCGYCAGSLIWQFNDCWPVESWAVQDYSRILKPAAYELRRLYGSNVICVVPEGDGWRIRVASLDPILSGAPLEIEVFDAESGQRIFGREVSIDDGGYLLRLEEPGARAIRLCLRGAPKSERWLLTAEPKNISFTRPSIRASGGTKVSLEVRGIAYDLVVSDADDAGNLPIERKILKGARAFTVIDGRLDFEFAKAPRRLNVRCLAGAWTVEVVP